MTTDPPSPSEPVESREQPRAILNFGCGHTFTSCPVCGTDATIRELRADRDSWRRVSERLEGEKVAALAEVSRLREQGEAAMAERDRARDFAAHLEADTTDEIANLEWQVDDLLMGDDR